MIHTSREELPNMELTLEQRLREYAERDTDPKSLTALGRVFAQHLEGGFEMPRSLTNLVVGTALLVDNEHILKQIRDAANAHINGSLSPESRSNCEGIVDAIMRISEKRT